jgi:hypothetical protein
MSTERPREQSFAMSPRLVAAFAIAAGVTAFFAIRADRAGRLLLGLAAVVLAVEAARGALARPVLVVDAGGLTVHTGLRRRSYRWDDIAAVRVDATNRRLAVSKSLEIDVGETLIALPAYRLGAPLETVAAALARI